MRWKRVIAAFLAALVGIAILVSAGPIAAQIAGPNEPTPTPPASTASIAGAQPPTSPDSLPATPTPPGAAPGQQISTSMGSLPMTPTPAPARGAIARLPGGAPPPTPAPPGGAVPASSGRQASPVQVQLATLTPGSAGRAGASILQLTGGATNLSDHTISFLTGCSIAPALFLQSRAGQAVFKAQPFVPRQTNTCTPRAQTLPPHRRVRLSYLYEQRGYSTAHGSVEAIPDGAYLASFQWTFTIETSAPSARYRTSADGHLLDTWITTWTLSNVLPTTLNGGAHAQGGDK